MHTEVGLSKEGVSDKKRGTASISTSKFRSSFSRETTLPIKYFLTSNRGEETRKLSTLIITA
jgi:hypothetical protein